MFISTAIGYFLKNSTKYMGVLNTCLQIKVKTLNKATKYVLRCMTPETNIETVGLDIGKI